eukprot:351999-Chlamydomonas_euryale.AAC.4
MPSLVASDTHLDRHDLDAVVAGLFDARQNVVAEVCVRRDVAGLATHTHVRFVDAQALGPATKVWGGGRWWRGGRAAVMPTCASGHAQALRPATQVWVRAKWWHWGNTPRSLICRHRVCRHASGRYTGSWADHTCVERRSIADCELQENYVRASGWSRRWSGECVCCRWECTCHSTLLV